MNEDVGSSYLNIIFELFAFFSRENINVNMPCSHLLQEIKNEYKFYKDAFIESGYYAPNTPLFSGNSQEIKDGEFKRSIDKLLEVWKLQN